MAGGQKLYPRATVKKIVKAHSKCSVSKNVDVLVSSTTRPPQSPLPLTSLQIFLDYALFLQTYATRPSPRFALRANVAEDTRNLSRNNG
jgi:hypothetical protein